MATRTICISAKCSDLFSATLNEEGKPSRSYDGYVPGFFPGKHYGDYVQLDIDVDTGRILNWVVPSQEALDEE